jgi:sulfite reductase (NADPH) flavoprotein alpha-component
LDTGIAPYRAFLQELEARKEATGGSPDTWLIFGNPHLRTDFLYQKEWLDWRQRGLLTRIDGAFSRDQAEKRYVQHVVREQAQGIAQWLDKGARIYVCGCLAMGHAVEEALREVLAQRGGLDAEQAVADLSELRRQGRLLKDLY